ncbi:hypothetical protein FRC02_007111 [Tulasnella sp. 418]|nr:hypothetical protein FRC02_007111 [Tulasnella sp. 418]
MYLAVESVYNKNTLQFLFLAIFNFSLLVYGGLQIYEVKENVDQYIKPGVSSAHSTQITALTIAVPCVIGIAEIAYIALGWKIWKEFGWKVYKFLGADRNIKRMYAQYQVFECLLKFDIFFYVGFSIQWLSLVLTDKDFEFWATVVALPVSLLLLVEGLLAARHENKWMMGSFMFGCVAGCAYFVYKAFRVYSNRKDADFLHLYKSLLIFACLSIILLCTTFISATIVMLNFGKGLKQSMNRKNDVHKLERRGTEYKGGLRPGGYNPKRMSIE